jgi:hypothetical protein
MIAVFGILLAAIVARLARIYLALFPFGFSERVAYVCGAMASVVAGPLLSLANVHLVGFEWPVCVSLCLLILAVLMKPVYFVHQRYLCHRVGLIAAAGTLSVFSVFLNVGMLIDSSWAGLVVLIGLALMVVGMPVSYGIGYLLGREYIAHRHS